MTMEKMKTYDIEEISNRLIDRLPELVEALGITSKYEDNRDHLSMACPIHEGDNPQGFSILKRGVGNWRCFTHNCHEQFGTVNGASVISLIQAYRKISFRAAVEWAAKFVGIEARDINEVESFEEKNKFIQTTKILDKKKNNQGFLLTRDYLRKNVKIPASYFRKRGFSSDILNKYDIGTCDNHTKPMYNRVIVPLYDDDGKNIIACTARSIFEKCEKCSLYHDPKIHCPSSSMEKLNSSKWRNTNTLSVFDSHLYNYQNCRKFIQDKNTVILVEGAPDVWKLEEAGIHNSAGLLGVKFTPLQRRKLEESGATSIVIATDNDKAGKECRERIRKECTRLFNIFDVESKAKDFGDSSIEEIKLLFKDFI